MTKPNKNILVLPRWYPNKTDIQLGIFIQRQLILMQNDFNFYVVYAQALDDINSDFEIVTTTKYPGLTEHIVYFRSGKGLLKKIINFNRYRKAQKIGMKEIDQPINLCHVHVPYRSAMPAIRLKRKNNIPFLVTEHWSGHLNGLYLKKNVADKLLYKRVLKKADRISTVSRALQTAFERNTGFDSQLIPNYIELQKPESVQPESDWINLLSVCDFHDKTKNISGMVGAFVMAHHLNPKLRLTIVGGGPDEAKIKKLVDQVKSELGIPEETIQLTGRKEHNFVLEAMHACDFYICNSNYETFGMTVAEALLAGKPVISTKCGGPEEFLDETNSLLIKVMPPGQVDPLVDAIIVLSKSYQDYDAKEISAKIQNRFGKTAIRNKWLDFYTI